MDPEQELKEKSAENDTRKHIMRVASLMIGVAQDLIQRAADHDQSKLEEPEASMFAQFTERLEGMEYSTEPDSEYQTCMKEMRAFGLDPIGHHYSHNDHHPEHYYLLRCGSCETVFDATWISYNENDKRNCPICAESNYEVELAEHLGIEGMTLMAMTEMLCDWKAAGERHKGGDIFDSIKKNTKRFNLSPQAVSLLTNTARFFWPETYKSQYGAL